MALWQLFYHVVWVTKEREPLITPEIEPELYGYIIGKADVLECVGTHHGRRQWPGPVEPR